MATIRTQLTNGVRRVITKVVNGQRRVSCSCCEAEAECCMYPAQGLVDDFYSAEDLPDSVFIATSSNVGDFREAIRDGVNFVIENGFAAGQDIVLGLNGNTWGLWVDAGSGPDFILGDYDGICLINWPYSEFDRTPAIQDNFADTYEVAGSILDGNKVTVTRKELCVWEGQITVPYEFGYIVYTALLFYSNGVSGGGLAFHNEESFGPLSLGDSLEWKLAIQYESYEGGSLIDVGADAGIKEPPQNTPVGSYVASVGGGTYTVS